MVARATGASPFALHTALYALEGSTPIVATHTNTNAWQAATGNTTCHTHGFQDQQCDGQPRVLWTHVGCGGSLDMSIHGWRVGATTGHDLPLRL